MPIDKRWLYPSIALISFVFGLKVANTSIFVAATKTSIAPLSGDAATWFGAIGAFLAFGATVWVATAQARQKNLEAHNLAVLAAARIAPSMAYFLQTAAQIERTFTVAVKAKVVPNFDMLLLRLESTCTWTPAEILPLVYLPNNVAYHLEQVKATLPQQIQNFRGSLALASTYDPEESEVSYDWDSMQLALDTYFGVANETTARVQIAYDEVLKIIPGSPLAIVG